MSDDMERVAAAVLVAAPTPLCRVATVAAAVGIERRKRSDAAFDAIMVDLFSQIL